MSDMSRKVLPDKGSLNRERPVTKALKFPFCTRKTFHLNRVRAEVYTGQRQDDTPYGGTAQSKKLKAKVAILKIILSLTGCQ